jgi:3-oxo-5-alpha-steroid 4-dehydrogenase 1
MTHLENPFVVAAIATFTFMVSFYLLALAKDDYSIVDVAWGLGFVNITVVSLIFDSEFTLQKLAFSSLILIWGLRLAGYLYARNATVGEDYRYQEMRKGWGSTHKLQAFFKVFMLQGVLMLIIAIPILHAFASDNFEISKLWQYLGLIIAISGLSFEIVADSQMWYFKKDQRNKGLVLNTGLWRYSRHPNYFGETVFWWGVFLVTLDSTIPIYIVVSPILITFLLLKVSGVTLLEQKLGKNSKYKNYQNATSAFIPWPPKPPKN